MIHGGSELVFGSPTGRGFLILVIFICLRDFGYRGPAQRRLIRATLGHTNGHPALSFLSSLVLRLQIAVAIHLGVGGCE